MTVKKKTENIPAEANIGTVAKIKELVLFTGTLEEGKEGMLFHLSTVQFRIVSKSLFKEGNARDLSSAYSDEELKGCTDFDRPYKSPLLSIRQATVMLLKQNISGAAIFLDPRQPSEQCIPLTVMQAAVTIGRLGINLENKHHLSDETLSVLFSKSWKPRFKKKTASGEQKQGWTKRNFMEGLLPPGKIKQALDRTIIGQEEAKLKISTAIYRQEVMLRYNAAFKNDDGFSPMRCGNLLLCGPTGSGKTAMITKLGSILDRPVVIIDSTTLTPAGYSGGSTADMYRLLMDKADGDPEKAATSIVFFDEWDKAFPGATGCSDLGRFRSSISFELLRMMDGCEVGLETTAGIIRFSTENILFILGGAFPNLDNVIRQRIRGADTASYRTIGFMADQEQLPEPYGNDELPEPTLEDLKHYGIPTEMLGRIGTICRLRELGRDELVKVLTDSDLSPLEEQRKLFGLHRITLDVPEETLQVIADMALERKLGVRGMASILQNVLSPVLFRNAENKRQMVLRLTPECFTAGAEPELRANISPGRSLARSAVRQRSTRLTS